MLIILLLFATIRTLDGAPVPSPLEAPVIYLRYTGVHFGQRTVSDIFTSCLATVFACTWSAVHLNVPSPTDSGWTCFKRQCVTMIYALLASEAITAWALRQYIGAKAIMDKYNGTALTNSGWTFLVMMAYALVAPKAIITKALRQRLAAKKVMDARNQSERTHKSKFIPHKIQEFFQDPPLPDGPPRWTLTHGFFLQMGGFMLSKNGRPIQALAPLRNNLAVASGNFSPDIMTNIRTHVIDPLLTMKEEIEDRSKGDIISKTLIILQTTWFIVQCITRWASHLPVSELEVVTLGFAMLNGITCWLWWHKPQSVGRPVFLEVKRDRLPPISRTIYSELQTIDYPATTHTDFEDSHYSDIILPESRATDYSSSTATLISMSTNGDLGHSEKPKKEGSYTGRMLHEVLKKHAYEPWTLLLLIPLHIIGGMLRPIGKLADVEVKYHLKRSTVECGDLRVLMFFSACGDDDLVHGTTALIGVLFGSVHLTTSWSLIFSSAAQMLLWLCSAVIITIAPVSLIFWKRNGIVKVIVAIWLALYIVARVILLSLSLTSLCTLPPAALKTIDWTTFLPHI